MNARTVRREQGARRRMAGYSVVELMVAVTLALIILAAVSTIFVSSKRTYHTQDRLARLQENARFAIQYISRDVRMAGYAGCMDEITNINNTLNSGSSFVFNMSIPVEGLENGAGNWYPSNTASAIPASMKAGTDALLIRFGDPLGAVNITKSMPNESAVLDVNDVTGFNTNEIIMVSDCSSADVMQITSILSGSLKLQHNAGAGSPGNSTQKLSKSYAPPAKVMKFKARLYYIKNRPDGTPALYMQENGNDYELVEDVEDMQVTYGVDTDATKDGVPNAYRKPGQANLTTSADWARLKSVRIGLLVRAPNTKDADRKDVLAGKDIKINDKTWNVTDDGYQRRVFETTIMLRNL